MPGRCRNGHRFRHGAAPRLFDRRPVPPGALRSCLRLARSRSVVLQSLIDAQGVRAGRVTYLILHAFHYFRGGALVLHRDTNQGHRSARVRFIPGMVLPPNLDRLARAALKSLVITQVATPEHQAEQTDRNGEGNRSQAAGFPSRTGQEGRQGGGTARVAVQRLNQLPRYTRKLHGKSRAMPFIARPGS